MSGHNALQEQLLAEFLLPDPGDGEVLSPDRDRAMYALKTSAAETRTLDDPTAAGIQITVVMEEDGGDCVVTADSAINQSANDTMTFADVGDQITLISIPDGSDGFRWSVVGNDGVALS